MGVIMVDHGVKSGLRTVLEEGGVGAPTVPDAPRQLDLLPEDDEADEPGASPLDVALERMAAGFGQPRRGRGRPKGARNRSTQDWQRLLTATRRSPLLVLADVYSMPVEELAGRLGCERFEAMKIQILAAREVAPYVHQRLPQAVSLDVHANLPTLVIGVPEMVNARNLTAGGAVGLDLAMSEIIENQCVSGANIDQSDRIESDNTNNRLI